MVAATTKERIPTDNEKYGSGFLDENAAGGVWIVNLLPSAGVPGLGGPAVVAANRQVAEDYIYAKCAEHPGRTPDDYSLQVWSVTTEWPPRDEEK